MQTFLPQGLPVEFESVSSVTATNSVNLGEVRFVNGEEYLYVYNAGAQQIVPGQFAVLSANSGYSVTQSSITGWDFPMGFVKHTTITTGAYGWLLTRGFTVIQNAMASTALAISDLIAPAAGGKVQTYTTPSLVTGVPFGYVVGSAVSAGSGLAYVKCFGT